MQNIPTYYALSLWDMSRIYKYNTQYTQVTLLPTHAPSSKLYFDNDATTHACQAAPSPIIYIKKIYISINIQACLQNIETKLQPHFANNCPHIFAINTTQSLSPNSHKWTK